MRKKILILPFVTFSLVLLTFFYLLIIDRNPSEIPSTLLNKNYPKFETESLLKKEKFLSVKEFENKTVLVNFFASWCKSCSTEHKFIQRFSDEINLAFFSNDSVSNFGIFLFNKLDGNSDGFLSIIKR